MIVRPVLCRPFIGRRDELAYLHELRRAAGSSKGGLVMLAGDAGVGKSRLIGEFCGSLAYARYRIARGACTEFGGQPYGPVLDVLMRLEGERRPLEPLATQREQIASLIDRVVAVTARTGVVIVVEDVHWADAATLDFLVQAAPRLRSLRALVVVSFRPDALHADHPASVALGKLERDAAGRVDLAPLRGTELRTFIREALAGVSLPDEQQRRVARAGEGNPFFTEELLKSAVGDRRALEEPAPGVPPTIAATLLRRLEPFDAHAKHVIGQAAVIGRTFPLALLAATLDARAEDLLPVLRSARDHQLIEELEPMLFRFRHGLTREAIYRRYLTSEVRPLHATVVLALERAGADAPIEHLAYHAWASGDAERSARYNEAAGDAASRVHAHEDAIAFYDRALAAPGLARMTYASILEKVAERRIALTWSEQAQATFARAADIFHDCGAYEREAGCRVNAAILAYTTNKPHPIRPLEQMLERLGADQYLARSRVHVGIAWLSATFGFPTRAAQHIADVDARALAEAPDIRLRVHNVSAFIAMTIGDLAAFRREHAAWLRAAEEAGAPRSIVAALLNGAMCFAFFALHDEAQSYIERSIAASRETRNQMSQESCLAFGALCRLLRGQPADAAALLQHVEPSTEDHVNFTFSAAWGMLAGLHLGDDALVTKWFDAVMTSGSRTIEVECGATCAEVLARRGRPDEAQRLLHEVLPACEMLRGNIDALLAVARYGHVDDRERARTYLQRAAAAPDELPERPALALFDAIEARRAGRDADARAHAASAADGFRRLGMPLHEAAALEVAGAFDDALAVYRRCGAAGDVQRLGGEVGVEDVPGVSTLAPLSERERSIAELARRGWSNVEIARELSISHKTVEKHLASVYHKLGISSRRALRAADVRNAPRAG